MQKPPKWHEAVTSGVDKAEKKRRRPAMTFNVDIEMRLLLAAAAETRGMTASAYARRAIAAFIARDLGLEFGAVTRFGPAVEDPENFAAKRTKATATRRAVNGGKIYSGGKIPATHDDGAGYGTWVVCDD